MNKKQRENKKENRIIKKARKEVIKQPRNKYVHWECIKCQKIIDIVMNNRYSDLYTEEREQNFICLNCRS